MMDQCHASGVSVSQHFGNSSKKSQSRTGARSNCLNCVINEDCFAQTSFSGSRTMQGEDCK